MAAVVKQKKVRCYYADTTRNKPDKTQVRHFIHSEESGGFWASVRDLTQTERKSNDAIGHGAAVLITVGYNERILELWDRLTILDDRGRSYRIIEKPDEYDYSGCDIKIRALLFHDKNTYGGDAYDY